MQSKSIVLLCGNVLLLMKWIERISQAHFYQEGFNYLQNKNLVKYYKSKCSHKIDNLILKK